MKVEESPTRLHSIFLLPSTTSLRLGIDKVTGYTMRYVPSCTLDGSAICIETNTRAGKEGTQTQRTSAIMSVSNKYDEFKVCDL